MAADIQIIMEVLGEQDVLKATKATDKLEKEVGQLNTAFRRGKISQADYVRGLNQLSSKNKQLGGGYNNLQKAVFSYASSIDQAQRENNEFVASQTRVNTALKQGQNQYAAYDTATYRANQTTKRFASVGLQQAGYQVGDFAVQLQSGTNAAVAFGQQGSQLLGIFGSFGAVLGAGLAIGTAIIAPLIEAKEEATDTGKAIDGLSEALQDLQDAQEKLDADNLAKDYGNFADQVERLAVATQDLSARMIEIKGLGGVAGVIGNLPTEEDFMGISGIGARLGYLKDLAIGRAEIGQPPEQAGRRARAEEISGMGIGLTPGQVQSFLNSFSKMRRSGDLEGLVGTMREFVDLARRGSDSFRDTSAEGVQLVQTVISLADNLAQAKAELDGSAEAARFQSEVMRISLKIAQGHTEANSTILNQQIEMFERTQDMKEELGEAAYNALRLSGIDMASGISDAAEETARLAAQMGIALERAAELQLSNRRNEMYAGRGTTSNRRPFLQGEEGNVLVSEILANNTSTGGAGGSMRQATQEANKFTEALNKMSGTAVELGKTMKDSVGGALMSIVDGTKDASDAFRDMARQILKKAFDLLVIQPLMNSLFGVSGGGGLFGLGGQGAQVVGIQSQLMAGLANGGALHNGRLMAFANGGVVDSPTLFPMANGAGLMGEAGPEAIMPLKRGKDGKLGVAAEGGSQPVNVTQQFIIQGNGDEYIMQKIKQSAPSIAQYTKNSLMDDRRRGGVVKQTFGG